MVDLKTLLGLDGEAVTDENNAVCYEIYCSTTDSACTFSCVRCLLHAQAATHPCCRALQVHRQMRRWRWPSSSRTTSCHISRATFGSGTGSACGVGSERGRRGSSASRMLRHQLCGAPSPSGTMSTMSGSSCGCCWTSRGAFRNSQPGELAQAPPGNVAAKVHALLASPQVASEGCPVATLRPVQYAAYHMCSEHRQLPASTMVTCAALPVCTRLGFRLYELQDALHYTAADGCRVY